MNRFISKSFALYVAGARIIGCTAEKKELQQYSILYFFSDVHATHATGAFRQKHNNPELQIFVQTPSNELQKEYLNTEYTDVVKVMSERLESERITVGDTITLKATSDYHK